MKKMVLCMAVALCALASQANAGPPDDLKMFAVANGISKHFNDRGLRLNEQNYGAGMEFECSRCLSDSGKLVAFLTAGQYKNSIYRESWYAGVGLKRRWVLAPKIDRLGIDAGLTLLFVSGYLPHTALVPALLPVVTLGTEHVSVNAHFIPPMRYKDLIVIPALVVQMKIRVLQF